MLYNPLALIITGIGIYMLTKVGGVLFRPLSFFRVAGGVLRNRENRSSFLLALAGTLGVGNVFGVSYGLIVGGAGSIFWMLVSSLFSSVLKYSEVLLSTSDGGEGGIYSSARRILGRPISTVYAILVIILGLFMGSALQSRTISSISGEIFDTPPYITSIFLAIITLFALLLGAGFIPKITAIIIPLSTIIYIFLATLVIVTHFDRLGAVLGDIMSGAFRPEASVGGIFGFLISRQVSEGYSRGILSNEAGAGTSTLAHGYSSATPHQKGVLGILEVIFDTVILCPITALMILVAIPDISAYSSAVSLLISAVSTIGDIFVFPFLVSVLIFGWSTIITWYYYVERSVVNLSGTIPRTLPFIYLFFILLGSLLPDAILVVVTDISLLGLTVIVSFLMIKNSDRIRTLSEQGLLNKSDFR